MLSNFRQQRSFAISGTLEQTILSEISLRTSASKPAVQIIASVEGSPDQETTIHRLLSSLPNIEGNVSVALPLHFFEIVMVSLPVMPKGAISKALPYHLAKIIDKPLQDFIYDWLLTRQKKDTMEISVYLFPVVTSNTLFNELSKKKLKLIRLEPDVVAAFAYLTLTRRLPVDKTTICTLVWPTHSSHAIYENDQLQMVRSVAFNQPDTPYRAKQEDTADPPPNAEATQPEPESEAKSSTNDVFMSSHDSTTVLTDFSLSTRADEPSPAAPPTPEFSAHETAREEDEHNVSTLATSANWPEYISNLGLEIIRTKDFYGHILKGSNINHLFIGGGKEFLLELGGITKEAMDIEPEELSQGGWTSDLPSPLDTICIGTGSGRSVRFRRINLVPQEPLSERLRVIIPSVIFVLLALIFVVIYLQDHSLATKISRITDRNATFSTIQEEATVNLANLRKLTGDLDKLQKQEISLKKEIGKIEAISKQKINYSLAISTIAMLLPSSLKCESISFRGRQGIIEGLALHHRDLPLAVDNLQENPVFINAFLKDIDTTADRPSAPLSFRIMVEIK